MNHSQWSQNNPPRILPSGPFNNLDYLQDDVSLPIPPEAVAARVEDGNESMDSETRELQEEIDAAIEQVSVF